VGILEKIKLRCDKQTTARSPIREDLIIIHLDLNILSFASFSFYMKLWDRQDNLKIT
jgi:hypothetical protein